MRKRNQDSEAMRGMSNSDEDVSKDEGKPRYEGDEEKEQELEERERKNNEGLSGRYVFSC